MDGPALSQHDGWSVYTCCMLSKIGRHALRGTLSLLEGVLRVHTAPRMGSACLCGMCSFPSSDEKKIDRQIFVDRTGEVTLVGSFDTTPEMSTRDAKAHA